MKKFGKVATLTVAGFMLFAFTNKIGDSSFEGIITYSITMDGDNAQAAQMLQGSSIKTYVKGDWSRTESNFGMAKQIVIADKKNPDGAIMLMDIMGNKYQIKMDDQMKKQAQESKAEIKYLDGTKTIAGYACKEAQISVKDKNGNYTSDVYYTDQLPYNNDAPNSKFGGLKGCPLSFSVKQQGMTLNMVCQSIEKQSVPDSLFKAPAGYKLMTQSEMQKDMMSHMSGGGQ